MIPSRLINVFMDGVFREIKAKSEVLGANLLTEGNDWRMLASFFAGDMVLFAEIEQKL